MFEESFTEFVWQTFSDENPEYDQLLLEVYGMIIKDEPKNVVECHVIDSIEKAFSGVDNRNVPSVAKSIRYFMGYHTDWRVLTERMIRAAGDLGEVAHAYVRTVARAHAIGEVRAYIGIYAAVHGVDGLSGLIREMDRIDDPFYPKFPLPRPDWDRMEKVCEAAAHLFGLGTEDSRSLGFSYKNEFIYYGEKFARDYINELLSK